MLINKEAHDWNFMVIQNNTLTFEALARNLQSGLLTKGTNKMCKSLFCQQ